MGLHPASINYPPIPPTATRKRPIIHHLPRIPHKIHKLSKIAPGIHPIPTRNCFGGLPRGPHFRVLGHCVELVLIKCAARSQKGRPDLNISPTLEQPGTFLSINAQESEYVYQTWADERDALASVGAASVHRCPFRCTNGGNTARKSHEIDYFALRGEFWASTSQFQHIIHKYCTISARNPP